METAQLEGLLVGQRAHPQRMRKPGLLCSRLRRQLRSVRNSYRRSLADASTGTASEWLRDNYYILHREGRHAADALAAMRPIPCGRDGMPLLYRLIRDFLVEGRCPVEEEDLDGFLAVLGRHRDLYEQELEALPALLGAAMLDLCVQALEPGRPSEPAAGMMAYAVSGLRALDGVDFRGLIERHSPIERTLAEDPAGAYREMDEDTRALYRDTVARRALREHREEVEVARQVVRQAQMGAIPRLRHVGAYLLAGIDGRISGQGRLLLMLQALLPALLAGGFGACWRSGWAAFLAFWPLWELLRPLLEWLCSRGVPAQPLPRMAMKEGISEEQATVICVTALLPAAGEAGWIERRLEDLYRKNPDGALSFLLLADYKPARYPHMPEDEVLLAAARREIDRLNRRYGDRFMLLVRPRRWCETQRCFCGWERKRGAILELCRIIRGQQEPQGFFRGDLARLRRARYLLALDADTGLLMDGAVELVRTAAHPLNRPVIDREAGRVTAGYGILVPRIATDLRSAGKSWFARVMGGAGGVSSYALMAGNLYQDLYYQGIFTGKGLIDVEAAGQLLEGAFPENRVLSHDVLEGGILRTGYAAATEMTDAVPSSAGPWFERMHRWLRGDWQNLPFLFSPVRGHHPLPGGMVRWFLWDNLRRALTPVMQIAALAALRLLPPAAGAGLAGLVLLGVIGPRLFAMLPLLFANGFFALTRRFYSRVLPQALEGLGQAVFELVLLPKTALVALDAALRSLFRMGITRRHLLEWRTAADSERPERSLGGILQRFGPAELAGFVLFFWVPPGLGRLISLVFLALLPLAVLSARPIPARSETLPAGQREMLLRHAASMWRFFAETFSADDHYLPPDHVQETPVEAVAHRTSPTNIGMMLLAVLSARDLGLIDTHRMTDMLDRTLTTVERLDKLHGNLYNWYDTRTLAVLPPVFVSTVDSGNLLVSLTALRQGILEYRRDDPSVIGLAERIRRLCDGCDLAWLYDRKKRLFSIGFDVAQGVLSASHYDFLMSEARMTSYYAIARRMVPRRHWEALGRTISRSGAYTGPISWTGTMFEYFMPALFLPAEEGTLVYEGLRYNLYCQKMRVRGRGIPWGISESGYYAFDRELGYLYKAHGVQKIGLKRGLNRELVISPYSTFLALPYDLRGAVKNLRRLQALGLCGRWGFYEAADFTRERIGQAPMAVVRSYMAHHIGMSLLAVDNALRDGVMQRRFMRDRAMASAAELLEERIPNGAVVFEDVELRRQEMPRERKTAPTRCISQPHPAHPQVHLLANGDLSLLLTDSGTGCLMGQGVDITRFSDDLLGDPRGLFAFFAPREGGILSPTFAPLYDAGESRYETAFGPNFAAFSGERAGLAIRMELMLHPAATTMQAVVGIENRTGRPVQGSLLIRFDPTLSRRQDARAHPLFEQLFVSLVPDADTASLLFDKPDREGNGGLYLACGLLEEIPFTHLGDPTLLDCRGVGAEGLRRFAGLPFTGQSGVPYVTGALRTEWTVDAGAAVEQTLLLCVGRSRGEAISRLIEARKRGRLDRTQGAFAPLAGQRAEDQLGFSLLPQLLLRTDGRSEAYRQAVRENRLGQPGLWSLGISGDFPLVLIHLRAIEALEGVVSCFLSHRDLRAVGIRFDLVVLLEDYEEALRDLLLREIGRQGLGELLGGRGGIHLIGGSGLTGAVRTLLAAAAVWTVPSDRAELPAPRPYRPMRIRETVPADPPERGEAVTGGLFWGRRFYVTGRPAVPWSHLLANPTFGTLLSDRSLGMSFAVNARENRLTPWQNDPAGDNRGERLLLRLDGRPDGIYNLVCGALASFSPDDALYEGWAEQIKTRVRVTVPQTGMLKWIDVTLQNTGEQPVKLEAAYLLEPVLGFDRATARYLSAEREGERLLIHNPYNTAVPGWMGLGGTGGRMRFAGCREALLAGDWTIDSLEPHPDWAVAAVMVRILPPGRSVRLRYQMSWAANRAAALRLLELRTPPSRPVLQNEIRVSTGDRAFDSLLGVFLPWQAAGCRVMARCGFYQCGGAWGYRDQLQDVLGLLDLAPALAGRQLLRAAACQFEEGDVLHWWHPLPRAGGGRRGVRTRYRDDFLWLPYVTAAYCRQTGDTALLDRQVPYLRGEPLLPGERERYFAPERSPLREPLYEHCMRALLLGNDVGPHGLSRIGGGDWSDGLNRVGLGGKGESVWLSMFYRMVVADFLPLCRERGDPRAEQLAAAAGRLGEAVDAHAWAHDRYLRAFYDDGEAMGGAISNGCTIDLLPQSFAVLARMPDAGRVAAALQSAWDHLVDRENRLVRLLESPFGAHTRHPGYIAAYPPGIRENGGQYTHAAVWYAWALLEAGRTDAGWEVLRMLSPADRCRDPRLAARYRLEPYYLAGDIYAHPEVPGRGGWSLYTGAAGWYYRVCIREALGIRREGDRLSIAPRLPDHLSGYSARIRMEGTEIELTVRRGGHGILTVDRRPADSIPLDGGRHRAELLLPPAAGQRKKGGIEGADVL